MDNKDLISQYIDTGLKIPEHQVNQLSNNDMKTYLRKRMISVLKSHAELEFYEYNRISEDNQKKYIHWVIKRHDFFPTRLLHDSSYDVKKFYVYALIDNRDYLDKKNFLELPDDLKLRYLKYRIDEGKGFELSFLDDLSPEMMYKFYYIYAVSPKSISESRYDLLPDDLKLVYLEHHIEGSDTDKQYKDRTSELKYKYITAYKNRMLNKYQLFITPDDLAMVYLKQRMNQGWDLTPNEEVRYESITNK